MSARITLHSNVVSAGCGIAILGSLAGLAIATGAGTVDRSLARALPSVVSAWQPVTTAKAVSLDAWKLSPVVLRDSNPTKSGPIAGDEGFWLSTRELAGSNGLSLAVGEHISIGDKTYTISELRPISSQVFDVAAKVSRRLILVVAQETETRATAPRTLRFLIDSEQTASPTDSAAASPAVPMHRAL